MSFNTRLGHDRQLKDIVTELFNTFGKDTHVIKPVGMEQLLTDIHPHIRHKRDTTTEIMRYMPDCLVAWAAYIDKPSTLLELKAAMTGFYKDNAGPLRSMREKVPDLRKEEVANVELASFNSLLRLRSIGAEAFLWMYVAYHLESRWLAVVPESELNLMSYSDMEKTRGSGTPIANLNVRIDNSRVYPLHAWAAERFEFDERAVQQYLLDKEQMFR